MTDELRAWIERTEEGATSHIPRHFVASALLARDAERYAVACGVTPIEALHDAAVVILRDAAQLTMDEPPDDLAEELWPPLRETLQQLRAAAQDT